MKLRPKSVHPTMSLQSFQYMYDHIMCIKWNYIYEKNVYGFCMKWYVKSDSFVQRSGIAFVADGLCEYMHCVFFIQSHMWIYVYAAFTDDVCPVWQMKCNISHCSTEILYALEIFWYYILVFSQTQTYIYIYILALSVQTLTRVFVDVP